MKPSELNDVKTAWRRSRQVGIGGPSPAMDRRLRQRARRMLDQQPTSPGWIWPVSVAASVVLCSTLMFPIAQFFKPPVPPAETYQPRIIEPIPARTVAIGESLPESGEAIVLELETVPPAVDSPEFWWQELRRNAADADREAFLATWHAYRTHLAEAPLPDDLKRWMAQNSIPASP